MNIGMILAGGMGSRMGAVGKPKQYIDVQEKPIMIYTLEAFEKNGHIDAICLVTLVEWMDEVKNWLQRYKIQKVRWLVPSGKERRDSSFNGLKAIKDEVAADDVVLIHDAARPLISQRIIDENIADAARYGATDTCIPAHDTIVRSIDGGESIDHLPVRSEIHMGQTPQSFQFSVIYEAQKYYEAFDGDKPFITDDAGVALFHGKKVAITMGDKLNIKVTTKDDLHMLNAILQMQDREL